MLMTRLPPGQLEPHRTEMKLTRMWSFWLLQPPADPSRLRSGREPRKQIHVDHGLEPTGQPRSHGYSQNDQEARFSWVTWSREEGARRAETARSHRLHLHTSPLRARLCPAPRFSGSPADSWSGFVFVPLNGNPGIVELCH